MRANEFLNELFQPGKKWQWSFTGSEEAVAVFHVGDVPYQFHAYTYSENPTVWEVEFKNASRGQQGRTTKYGLTGTGNSAEVMSTIADIMREFLQRYQGSISELMFTAEEPSRQRLYGRMAQRLLPDWEIVQSGKNFTLVAPETVTEDSTMPPSAGCIIVAEDTGRWCLQQRSYTVSDPGVWSTWGGGVEPGETLEQAVRRELAEEGGYTGPIELEHLHQTPKYATFIARVPKEFEPKINHECKDWCWIEPGNLPTPLHPGLVEALSTEPVDLEAIHAEALREHLLSNPELYENRDDYQKIRDFLNLHVTRQPKVGNSYVYASVQSTPAMNFFVLSCFEQPHRLVAIDQKYVRFDLNGTIKPFPEHGTLSGDALSQIYFFDSVQQFEKFFTLLNLKFSNYKKSVKILDSDINENFAGGRKPGRKGLSKRMNVPTTASVSKLRKIAKNSTGERQRMVHWLANMKAGRNKNK